jgi:hypothetical protein
MGPLDLFAHADSPYAFYGYLPTLFDGRSRFERDDMDWLAHSFLAATHAQCGPFLARWDRNGIVRVHS